VTVVGKGGELGEGTLDLEWPGSALSTLAGGPDVFSLVEKGQCQRNVEEESLGGGEDRR